MKRLGQRLDTLSKKNSANPMPCGRISQERIKESLLLKSWDLKHEVFGSPAPPHGRILHPHDPYFLAHELRKRYHFIWNSNCTYLDLFLWEKTAHSRREKGLGFLVGIVAEFLSATCQEKLGFFKEKLIEFKTKVLP